MISSDPKFPHESNLNTDRTLMQNSLANEQLSTQQATLYSSVNFDAAGQSSILSSRGKVWLRPRRSSIIEANKDNLNKSSVDFGSHLISASIRTNAEDDPLLATISENNSLMPIPVVSISP